jgi:hypothetical protein
MIRSRLALVAWSAVVAAVALTAKGWIVGAVLVLWFMAIAPGSAACRLLKISRERDWITVIATSVAIDALWTETMLYAHVWTPERGVVALAVLTVFLVGLDRQLSRA